MTRSIEQVFVVAVPVDRAWRAFTDANECARWQADEYAIDAVVGGKLRYVIADLPPVEGVIEEVEARARLRYSERGLLPDTTVVTVVFEAVDTGTRITLTHAGFGDGPGWDDAYEGHALGWSQAIRDLVAYLEDGVVARRFVTPMLDTGMSTRETAAGLRVAVVRPGSFADEAGVRAGDLVLRVGDVPIYTRSDLWSATRESAGDRELTIQYARGGRVRAGAGRLRSGDHVGGA